MPKVSYQTGACIHLTAAVQEVLVLAPGHHRLWELPQVQFEQGPHRVDIRVTAGAKTFHMSLCDMLIEKANNVHSSIACKSLGTKR